MGVQSTLIILSGLFFLGFVEPQGKPAQVQDSVQHLRSALDIVTKVPFNGQYYYIRIIPLDSTNRDQMPIVDPSNPQRYVVWPD